MKPILMLASAAALVAAPAAAQELVIGKSEARSCYESAKRQDYSNHAAKECTEALRGMVSQRDRAATYVNRGIIEAGRGNRERALADYEAALRLKPKLSEAFANRGNLHRAEGRLAAALADYDRAIEYGPKEPHLVHFNRAVVREQTGAIRDAYFDYKRASELAPDWPPPQRELKRFTVEAGS